MNDTVEIRVPDIGDFKDIDVIEVLVKPGDAVEKETSLITVESDKATMEIPSPAVGVVKELKLKIGDKVSEGTLIMLLDTAGAAAAAPAPQPSVAPAATQSPSAPSLPKGGGEAGGIPPASTPATTPAPASGSADLHADVVVLGSGPGGYTAAFRAADLGKRVVLVERYPSLGGVCTNVGCIPSKALLHVARVITEAGEMAHSGITFGKPKIEIDKLRAWKDGVIGKLTQGLAALVKQRKVTVVQGKGEFASPNMIRVDTKEGV